MKLNVILIPFLLLMLSCNKKKFNSDMLIKKNLIVSELIESNVNEDHTSEGLMITLKNGNIVNFYRNDQGISGDHIGNKGKIVKRVSNDSGQTWSSETTVYSDEFDDRNIRGGISTDGTIILFFRRFNALGRVTIDINYILSFDGGANWSKRKIINIDTSIAEEVWIDNIINLENGKYLLPVHGISYCEIRYLTFKNNEIKISEKKWEWNFAGSNSYQIDEPMFVYLKNERILGLFRDDSKKIGSNYLQVQSDDMGVTWSSPIRTNIAAPFFCPSPLVFYDDKEEKIIVVATDRRQPANGKYLQEEAEIWIYSNSIDDVFYTPSNYKLVDKFKRPNPSGYQFYGYPCFVKTKRNDYLIVVTDSYRDNMNENADLYQFNLKFE